MFPWSIRLPARVNTAHEHTLKSTWHVLQPSQNYSSCDINVTGHDYWNTRYLVKGWKNIKGTQIFQKQKYDWSWKNLYINTKYAFSQLLTGEARRMKTPGRSAITEKHGAKIPNSTAQCCNYCLTCARQTNWIDQARFSTIES